MRSRVNSIMLAGLLALAAFIYPVAASEYFVSPTGADQNAGSKGSPFQTLERAAREMKPGDICWLRGGRYQAETVLEGLKGQPGNPLVFKCMSDERVVMDGTTPLPAKWTAWKDGIYQLKADEPVWQLFADGKLVYVARWPNASFEDGSIWRMEECMRFTDREFVRGKPAGQTKDGLIYDRNPQSHEPKSAEEGADGLSVREGVNQTTLAETGVDFSGAVAVLNLHHWLTWARPITDHKAGRNWFHYDSQGTQMAKYAGYYILGLPTLDRPNEWWYDVKSETIYFRPPDDRNPNQLSISGKVRDYSLRLIDCSHVVFRGLDFFGSAFSMTDCDQVVIEDGRLTYPSTHKFMLGDFSWFSVSADPDRANRRRSGREACRNVLARIINRDPGRHGNVLRNCEIAFANSPAIAVESAGSIVENCYIHDTEWDVNSSGGSGTLPAGAGCIIRRNTIHTAGNSEGIRPGPGSLVEYNRLWNMSNLQHDGSAINVGTGAQRGTLVRHNWVHDTHRAAIRFDSTISRMGSGGCVHHNVVFNLGSGGSKFKGDHHFLFNNTFYDSYFAIPNRFGDTSAHNRHTLVRNNLADSMVAWSMRRPDEKINARLENNLCSKGIVAQCLRDPANLDFRPKPGSAAIDAGRVITDVDRPSKDNNVETPQFNGNAPDIGAYEADDARYWIPGRMQAKASSPIPPDGAQKVRRDASLMFLEASGAKRHIVTFNNAAGDHNGQLELNGSNIADPVGLRPGQTYSWRVDAVLPDGTVVEGNLWTFTVEKSNLNLKNQSTALGERPARMGSNLWMRVAASSKRKYRLMENLGRLLVTTHWLASVISSNSLMPRWMLFSRVTARL